MTLYSECKTVRFIKQFMESGSAFLLKSLFIFLTGGILYFKTRLPIYTVLFWASALHLLLEILFSFLNKHPLQGVSKSTLKQTHSALMGISFALYAYVAMNIWGSLAIFSIALLGGVLDWIHKRIEPFYRFSGFLALLLLALSIFTTTIPNVLLLDKFAAAQYAEEHKFFLRGQTQQEDNYFGTDQIIINQSPAPGQGLMGTNLVFAFRGHHMSLDFLPFPVWRTIRYELASVPEVYFTAVQKGHGDNSNPLVTITEGKSRTEVSQCSRIYGTLQNWSKGNISLYLRLFVMPDMQTGYSMDMQICRWFTQPHKQYHPSNRFSDCAEMNIDPEQGTWYADVFFGNPYNADWRFRLRAIITPENYQRGQVLSDKELALKQSRLSDFVKAKTDKTIIVYREKKTNCP